MKPCLLILFLAACPGDPPDPAAACHVRPEDPACPCRDYSVLTGEACRVDQRMIIVPAEGKGTSATLYCQCVKETPPCPPR